MLKKDSVDHHDIFRDFHFYSCVQNKLPISRKPANVFPCDKLQSRVYLVLYNCFIIFYLLPSPERKASTPRGMTAYTLLC